MQPRDHLGRGFGSELQQNKEEVRPYKLE